MPRGKDAPTRTGGQIDPYVQRSIQQDKQSAENRLLTSMQEAGATQRANIASRTQIQTEAMRGRTQLTAQAAQASADDRRAAEAERGRRDDMKFTNAMQESTQMFQAKQAELSREHGIAMVEKDYTRTDKLENKRIALRRFEIEKQTATQERTTNVLLSTLKGMGQRELAKEKGMTTIHQEIDTFDKDKTNYEQLKGKSREKMSSDKRMDYPIADVLKEKIAARKRGGILGIATRGPIAAISAGVDIYKSYKEVKELKGVANPLGVLQDQLKVSVEDLAPENIHRVEKEIQKGAISPIEIRNTLGSLDEMIDLLDQKKKENPLDKDEVAYDFWNNTHRTVIDMRDALEGLSNSKEKMEGDDNRTVGSQIQYSRGVINNNSLGGLASRARELTGGNFDAMWDELTKSLSVPALWEIGPGMSTDDREIREEENAMLMRLYPELGGVE